MDCYIGRGCRNHLWSWFPLSIEKEGIINQLAKVPRFSLKDILQLSFQAVRLWFGRDCILGHSVRMIVNEFAAMFRNKLQVVISQKIAQQMEFLKNNLPGFDVWPASSQHVRVGMLTIKTIC